MSRISSSTLRVILPIVFLAADLRAVETPVQAAADPKARIAELNERTLGLAKRMDDLSAEAQDLVWNHTNTKLTDFLKEIDNAMLDARDLLEAQKTGGDTVAAQQDVLEKIYEAAKKAAQNSAQQQQQQEGQEKKEGQGQGQGQGQPGEQGDSSSMDAMLKMMEQMLGITPAEQPGQQGSQPGNQPGNGLQNGPGTGDDDPLRGRADKSMSEERTVPRAAGNPAGLLPPEFRGPMESFRKAVDDLELEEARGQR